MIELISAARAYFVKAVIAKFIKFVAGHIGFNTFFRWLAIEFRMTFMLTAAIALFGMALMVGIAIIHIAASIVKHVAVERPHIYTS